MRMFSKDAELVVTKFYVEPSAAEGSKKFSKSQCHMTNTSAMPVDGYKSC